MKVSKVDPLGREFIAIIAACMAMAALSIDLLLPAFPELRSSFGLAADSTEISRVITAFFLGLAVVIPLLGHATWHLYRKVIAPDPYQRPAAPRLPREKRPAADFPANLFPWRRKHGA